MARWGGGGGAFTSSSKIKTSWQNFNLYVNWASLRNRNFNKVLMRFSHQGNIVLVAEMSTLITSCTLLIWFGFGFSGIWILKFGWMGILILDFVWWGFGCSIGEGWESGYLILIRRDPILNFRRMRIRILNLERKENRIFKFVRFMTGSSILVKRTGSSNLGGGGLDPQNSKWGGSRSSNLVGWGSGSSKLVWQGTGSSNVEDWESRSLNSKW